MHLLRRRRSAALGLLLLAGALATGCGSTSTSSTAHIRGVDLAVNAGTAGILVNNTALGGDLSFGQVSTYNFVGQGVSTFGLTTSVSVPTTTVTGTTVSAVIPPSTTLQLNNDSYYTAYLIGRVDVAPLTAVRADPRFLQTVVAGSKGAAANYQPTATGAAGATYADPPSGQANIRILNGAPDAGPVDVLIGGTPAFTAVTYPLLPLGINTVTVGTTTTARTVPAVNPVTAYTPLPSGTLSVQVNAAGTSTVLVPPTNISVGSGQSYTLVVTETAATPTYSVAVETD